MENENVKLLGQINESSKIRKLSFFENGQYTHNIRMVYEDLLCMGLSSRNRKKCKAHLGKIGKCWGWKINQSNLCQKYVFRNQSIVSNSTCVNFDRKYWWQPDLVFWWYKQAWTFLHHFGCEKRGQCYCFGIKGGRKGMMLKVS